MLCTCAVQLGALVTYDLVAMAINLFLINLKLSGYPWLMTTILTLVYINGRHLKTVILKLNKTI